MFAALYGRCNHCGQTIPCGQDHTLRCPWCSQTMTTTTAHLAACDAYSRHLDSL